MISSHLFSQLYNVSLYDYAKFIILQLKDILVSFFCHQGSTLLISCTCSDAEVQEFLLMQWFFSKSDPQTSSHNITWNFLDTQILRPQILN